MKKRILIVDDDAAIAEPLGLLLASHYQVDTAANGAEAIARMNGTRYDVVLLDLKMPVMDGSAFKAYLDRQRIRVPVLLMSGSADLGERAIALGVADYVPKPIDASEILQRVAALVSHAA